MRLLLDQDVYSATYHFLVSLDHDVTRAGDLGLATASDETILDTANQADAILITRDRDFGQLVFVRRLGIGVVFLRLTPTTIDAVHGELALVLNRYSDERLRSSFIVITERGHRIRTLL